MGEYCRQIVVVSIGLFVNKIVRSLILSVCVIGLPCLFPALTSADESDFRVTLLGTGDPIPRADRFGPATLVEAGGQKLLFDVGRGASQRLAQLNVPLSSLDGVFITHFHSDHVNGLPDLWMTGWVPPPLARRGQPFEVWGPVGTQSILDNLKEAFAANTASRVSEELLASGAIKTLAHEFDVGGVVFQKEGVIVTAFEVDHGERVETAFGYRVDYDGRSIVISGDTRYDENLIEAAKGADLVIHEVVLASEELIASEKRYSRIAGVHTTPEEAGEVFTKINPKMAVYTHLVLLSSLTIPEAPLSSLVSRTRTTYDGPLVVGEDLMSFTVDENVTISSSATTSSTGVMF